MKSSKAIQREINELVAEVESIANGATSANRQLTEEEVSRIDEIQGVGSEGGLLGGLRADYDRILKVEARANAAFERAGIDANGSSFGKGVVMRSPAGEVVKCFGKGQTISNSRTTESLGELVSSLVTGRSGSETISNALTQKSSGGDVLVPEEIWSGFLDLARARSVVMEGGCQTLVMNAPEVRLVSVVSDPTITEKSEAASWTPSDMVLGQVRLQSRTMGCVVELSREELEDAANAGDVVTAVLSAAMAAKLDALALAGTGSSEFAGLTTISAVNETGSTGSLTWSKLSAAATAIRGRNFEPNYCVLNPTPRDALLLSADTTGQWIPAPPTLAGVTMAHTTALGATYAVLGDFTKAVFGVRKGATLEATTMGSGTFEAHTVRIKITWRGDFGLLYPNAFHRLTGIS